MSIRYFMNLVESVVLDEAGAGASRIVQHIHDGTPFIMLSAMRADLSPASNKARTTMLRNFLAKAPVSFIVVGGEFHELGRDEPSEEVSFLVIPSRPFGPEGLREIGVKLMDAFVQDAIVFGDGETIRLLFPDGTSQIIGDAASFDPAVVANSDGFSKIGGLKFTFTNTSENPKASQYGGARTGRLAS